MQKTSNSDIRKKNTSLIRKFLLDGKPHSREELAAKTDLSVGTCRNILDDMETGREVIKVENGASTGGRPALQFQYVADFVNFLLVRLKVYHDTQGIERHIAELIFVDAVGSILEHYEVSYDLLSVEKFTQVVLEAVTKNQRIGVVSVSYPGVVLDGKSCCWSDISALSGHDLQIMLQESCGKRVVIENDINLSVCGYAINHKINTGGVAYIGFPQKNLPGCGLLIDGKLFRGQRGFAGEIIYLQNLTIEQLHSKLATSEGWDEFLLTSLRAITGLFDPAVIVVSDSRLTPERVQEIRQKCAQMAKADFLPEIHFSYDYIPDNTAGMLEFARKIFYKGN